MQKLEECQIFASKSENCDHSLPMMVLYDFKPIRLQMNPNDVIDHVLKSGKCPEYMKQWARQVKWRGFLMINEKLHDL